MKGWDQKKDKNSSLPALASAIALLIALLARTWFLFIDSLYSSTNEFTNVTAFITDLKTEYMGKRGTGDQKLKFPIQPSSLFPIFLPLLQPSPTARTDYWPLDMTMSRNQVRVWLWNFQLIERRRVTSHYHGSKFLDLNKRYDDSDGVTLSDSAFSETSDRLSKLTHFVLLL